MIRIRHSVKPYQELELEGSNADFTELRSAILNFCDNAEPTIGVVALSEFDPAPYQQRLKGLRLCKTGDPLLISVADGQLYISGKPKYLRLFAENLPWDAVHNSTIPYHVHFDRVMHEEQVSEASLDIILALQR